MRSPRSRQRAPGAGAASHEPARSHPQGRVVHDVAATARAACKSSAAERTVVHVAFHTIKTLEARSKSSNDRIPRKSLSPVEKSFPASYVMLGLKGAGAPIMAIGCLSLRPVANDIPKWRAHGGSAAFGEGHVRYVSAGAVDFSQKAASHHSPVRLMFMVLDCGGCRGCRGCRLWQTSAEAAVYGRAASQPAAHGARYDLNYLRLCTCEHRAFSVSPAHAHIFLP